MEIAHPSILFKLQLKAAERLVKPHVHSAAPAATAVIEHRGIDLAGIGAPVLNH